MEIKNKHIFFFLCGAFLLYSLSIYLRPLEIAESDTFQKEKAQQGRLVWQKYNCQACHQLYGLGGYLGPDLTNIVSKQGKGEALIKAMVRSGTKQMPANDLSETEMQELIEFLKSTDASGTADPRTFETNGYLMIEGRAKP